MARQPTNFVIYQSDSEVLVTTPDKEQEVLDRLFDTAETWPVNGRLTEDEWNRLEDLDEDRFLDVDERSDVFEREESADFLVQITSETVIDVT